MRKISPYNFLSIIGGLYIVLSFLFPLLWSGSSFAQTTYGSEAELKKQAAKFFESEDYVAAAPLYSQLLSLYPKEATYNYRVGVCFLFVDKDKNKSLSYLEEAVKMKGCPDDVSYFLGRAYHLNYQFDDAISALQQFEKIANGSRITEISINGRTYSLLQYKKIASKQDLKKYAIDRQIAMCRNAKQLTSVKHFIDTLEQQEVAIDAYYSAYDLNKYGGKILATPDMYRTSIDKKKGENKTLFLSRETHSVYLSSNGNDDKNGRNIFKLLNYSDETPVAPQDLGNEINTPYDEDYPFITPDGKTLYFSSKGHNSMGGYDVFKSIWDENTQTWTEPENLGTPINSPYDDFFFAVGTEDNEAYFSTTRESDFGKLQVYKIKLREKPLDYVTIAGEIKSQDVQNTKISVINSENKLIAVVTPNPDNGKYSMSLPPNQNYKLVVEKEGFLPHAENISIPNQVKSSPIKQEIVMNKNSSGEEMLVSNSFRTDTSSAASENKQELKSEFKYEDKDKLQPVDINGTTVMVTPPTNKVEESSVTTQRQDTKNEGQVANTEFKTQNSELKTPNSQPLSKNVSNSDIINNAGQEALALNTEAKKMKREAQTAMSDATQMQSLAKAKEQNAKDILTNAEFIKDNTEKQKETERGNKLQNEAEVKIKEAELAIFKAKQMEEEADKKQQEADLAFANVRELEKSSGIKVSTDKGAEDENNKPTSPSELAKQYKEDAQKAFASSQNLKTESVELLKQAEGLKEEAKTQNEPEKENTLQRAYNIEALAKEREASANKELSKAQQLQDSVKQLTGEDIQFAANIPSISENSSSATKGKLTPEHVTQIELAYAEAKQLRHESDSLNNKAIQAAEDAKTLKRTAAKKKEEESKALTAKAVEKNNEANKKLFYANELEDSLNKLDNVTVIAKNTTIDNNAVSSQNSQSSISNSQSSTTNSQPQINPEISANTQEQQLIATNDSIINQSINQQSIIVPSFVSAEHKKEIENSFAEAKQLQVESDSLSNRALEVFKEANQLKKAKMKEKKAEGQELINLSMEKKTKADERLVYANQLKDSLITKDSVETQNLASLQKPSVNTTEVQQNNLIITQENQPTQNNIPITTENQTSQNNLTATTETQTEQKPVATKGKQPTKKNTPATVEKQVEQKPAEKTLIEIQSMTAEEKKRELETATAQSKQLEAESEALARESQDIFQKARRMANPAEKNVMMKKSTELNNQSIKKQKESENKSAYAKKIQSTLTSPETPVVTANQQRDEGNQQATSTSGKPTPVEVSTTQQPQETPNSTISNSQSSIHNPQSENDENLDKNHPDYPKYIALLEEVKLKEDEAKQLKESATALESEVKQNTEDARNYKEQAQITDKKKNKQHLLAMGQEAERKAKEKQTTADESNAKAEELSKAAKEKNEEAVVLKKTIQETKASGITEVTKNENIQNSETTNSQLTIDSEKSELHSVQQPTIPNPQSTTTNPQTANTYNIEQLVVIQSNTTVSVYSLSNPIPVNSAMPEGLYFKIQIGAFRNPIPQDLFKGMQPVTGETTNNGLTRYTAGMFRAFQPADWAKNEIRQIGYPDAFVVAYYNGKRISMAEAKNILRNTSPQQKQQYVAAEAEEMKTLKKYNIYPEKYPKQINNPAVVAFKEAVQAKGTEAQASVIIPETTSEITPTLTTDEFYYTVQVGAYRHPEFPATLKDVQPITKEQVANDLYRYTSGKYNNFTDANAAKNALVPKVKDAFVIAFYKGKKITALKEAQRIENTIKNQIPQKNKEKTQTTVEQKQIPEKQNVPIQKGENTIIEIIFKVQIGAFREKVPVEIFNKFLKIRNKGISNKINAEGLNVFYVGNVKDYQAADVLKTEISTTAELPDAFIVAFKGNKQISIDEALKMIEKK